MPAVVDQNNHRIWFRTLATAKNGSDFPSNYCGNLIALHTIIKTTCIKYLKIPGVHVHVLQSIIYLHLCVHVQYMA